MNFLSIKLICIIGCLLVYVSGKTKEETPPKKVKMVAARVPRYPTPIQKKVAAKVPQYIAPVDNYYEPPTAASVAQDVHYPPPEYYDTAEIVADVPEEVVAYIEPPVLEAVVMDVPKELVAYIEPPVLEAVVMDVEEVVAYLVSEPVIAGGVVYDVREEVAYIEPPVLAAVVLDVPEAVVSYLVSEPVVAEGVVYDVREEYAYNEPPVLGIVAHGVTSPPVTTSAPKPLDDIHYMKQLFKDFIEETDTKIRPVINQSKAIHVHTKFVPISILHFDTTEQKFSILAYFRVFWNDELITWKPKFYNGLYYMKVPTTDIWKPNLIIEKPFDGEGIVGNEDSDIAVISWLGDAQWVPDGTYSVVCEVNIQYYPFDEQVCTISYYMADEVVSTLELTHDAEVTTEELTENSAWIVTSLEVKTLIQNDVYHVKVDFNLRRRPNYTAFTLIAPLMMLAFLNMCIFLVPADSGEKGGIAITIFLSYGIFISIISESLPNNSIQTSYFLIFIAVLLILSVLSVFYVIFQAKMVASRGIKESLVKCFIPEFMQGKERIDGAQRSMNQFVNANAAMKNNDIKTAWKLIFHKIDMVIFFTFLLIAFAATTTFFCLMLKRISESDINIVK
ncbi:Neuronal acetylcholine receptor subunit [Mactra antiquata]